MFRRDEHVYCPRRSCDNNGSAPPCIRRRLLDNLFGGEAHDDDCKRGNANTNRISINKGGKAVAEFQATAALFKPCVQAPVLGVFPMNAGIRARACHVANGGVKWSKGDAYEGEHIHTYVERLFELCSAQVHKQ